MYNSYWIAEGQCIPAVFGKTMDTIEVLKMGNCSMVSGWRKRADLLQLYGRVSVYVYCWPCSDWYFQFIHFALSFAVFVLSATTEGQCFWIAASCSYFLFSSLSPNVAEFKSRSPALYLCLPGLYHYTTCMDSPQSLLTSTGVGSSHTLQQQNGTSLFYEPTLNLNLK